MVNKNPSGLKAYNEARRKKKRLEKQVELAEDLEELEGIDMSDVKRMDAYVINLTYKYPNDVKVANAVIKWYAVKQKEQKEVNLLDADV